MNRTRRYILLIFTGLILLSSAYGREYLDLSSSQKAGDGSVWQSKAKTIAAPCIYRSVDQFGDSVTLSGKIFIPKSRRADKLILCPHYTISANSECPSECTPAEAFLAKKNYIVVMPDYLGYGITVDRMHPYLDIQLTVENTLDMLQAARSYLSRTGQEPLSDSIIIVGFSQGAAVAIGSLEQIERRKLCPVSHCYASSGPYDVAVTFDLCAERDYIGMAFVVPAFVMGTDAAYDLHIHPDTIFTPWMLRRYVYALSKKHNVVATAIHLGKGKLSKYLSPAGLDKTKGENKRLYEGYLRSSLVHMHNGDTIMSDWCPQAPIYLMHSSNDDLVNFECAENLCTMFVHNGAKKVTYDFGEYGGHIRSLIRFFRYLNTTL